MEERTVAAKTTPRRDSEKVGLGWVGLGWVGLGWVGLGCIRPVTVAKLADASRNHFSDRQTGRVFKRSILQHILLEEAMRPDRVEVLWDAAKSNRLIRIETGEEVVRRHCEAPKNADDQTLRSAIQKAVEDESYELDPTSVSIRR